MKWQLPRSSKKNDLFDFGFIWNHQLDRKYEILSEIREKAKILLIVKQDKGLFVLLNNGSKESDRRAKYKMMRLHIDYARLLEVRKGKLRTEKIVNLTVNIQDKGQRAIKDTPHFAYVNGDKDVYKRYYEKYMGTRFVYDHAPEAFDELIKNFKYEQPILVKGNQIADGAHRAAILLKNKVWEITVEDLETCKWVQRPRNFKVKGG